MQQLADEGFKTVWPNAKSWNSVLNTLSSAKFEDTAQRAEEHLHNKNNTQ